MQDMLAHLRIRSYLLHLRTYLYQQRTPVTPLRLLQGWRACGCHALLVGGGTRLQHTSSDSGSHGCCTKSIIVLHIPSPSFISRLENPHPIIQTACEDSQRPHIYGIACMVWHIYAPPIPPQNMVTAPSVLDPSATPATPFHTGEGCKRLRRNIQEYQKEVRDLTA